MASLQFKALVASFSLAILLSFDENRQLHDALGRDGWVHATVNDAHKFRNNRAILQQSQIHQNRRLILIQTKFSADGPGRTSPV
jgi:SH3-like domain-containing protein